MTYRFCKRMTVLFSAVVLMLAGIAVVTAAGETLGDADKSGAVDINDVTCIQRTLAGLKDISDISPSAADIDENGKVEIIDATYIQRYLAKIETPYPIGEQPTEAPTEAPTQLSTDAEGWSHQIFQP